MRGRLPKPAYTRLTWRDNTVQRTPSHKHAWLRAGWQVERVDLPGKLMRFVRIMQ